MKIKRNPIANAIKIALYSGLLSTVALTGVAYAQDDDDESVEKLEKTVVTGSRIKRSDVEGAVPVTIITREEIELSGQSSAADLLRNMTFNSMGSFRPQSGSSLQSVSTINLRGIGAGRSLVLIDGRRLPMAPTSGQAQDLNMIPLGAIERIEILSDGASAIYGSDAIGGVVNIITRTDYEGFEIMLGGQEVSVPSEDGGSVEEGSILFGAASEKTSVIAGLSWNSREIIFAREFPWTSGTSFFGNNFSLTDPDTGALTFNIIPSPACDFPNSAFFTAGSLCRFNFTEVSADDASIDNKSLYVKVKHDISDNWQVWANTSVVTTESFGRYAPVPDSRFLDAAGVVYRPLSVDSPNNPTNPNSPLYDPSLGLTPAEVDWFHRFAALGNRDNTVRTLLTDIDIGVIGTVADKFEVELGVRHTNSTVAGVGRNYLLRSAAQTLIESGEYSLANPFSTPESVLNQMRFTTFRDAKYTMQEVFGSVSFDMFEMTHGAAQLYVGAESRKIKYADIYDPQSAAGAVGGSAGNSAGGNRRVTSIYFEALIPVLENLEVSLAGRSDDYSDYGSDFSPKIAFRYQPLDNLTFRASFGEGFRAPSLDMLTQDDAFSADSVFDPVTCGFINGDPDNNCQINALSIGNVDLTSESSKQFSVGAAYEPTDWFNMTLDYYNISIENRLRSFTSQSLIILDDRGDPIPDGMSVVRDANGIITQVIRGWGNQGDFDVSGIDLNLRFSYSLLGGNMLTNLQVGHTLDMEVDNDRPLISDPGLPEQRVSLNNRYSYGDWSAAYNINMIGSQYDDVTVERDAAGNFISQTREGHVPTWVTHDLQINYHAPWDGVFTIGARNLTAKLPPIGLGDVGSRDYDFNLYDGYGRTTYIRYRQSF
ncbi:MAG: TonB-dependent receptor [Proteobacteria bacterium]|nr:TonB-dependent receptor [Pseudomonadota bacterium]